MPKNSEFEAKKKRISDYMDKKKIKALLLAKKSNFFWATCGGRSQIVDYSELGFSYLLYYEDKFYLLTTNIEAQRMLEEELSQIYGIEAVTYMWFEPDGLKKRLTEIVDISDIYQDWPLLQEAKMLDTDFDHLRFRLTEQEKKRYYNLCRDTSKCITSTCKEIKAGMTEFDIQASFSERLISSEVMPFLILIGSDERLYKYRHPIPTDKKIERYVMVVVCGLRDGLIAACTRFVHFGSLSEDLIRAREIILEIDSRMILSSRPGKSYSEILREEAETFMSYGHEDEWHNHHQGGPLGYEGRYFLVTPYTEHVIQKDNAIAWNPSIRGFKSEDTIIVEEESNKVATYDEDWPSIEIENEFGVIRRPDILIK